MASTKLLKGLQHELYYTMWDATNDHMMRAAGRAEAARVLSASGFGAGHFILATPANRALAMSDDTFAYALAARLGLDVSPRHPVRGLELRHASSGVIVAPLPLRRFVNCRKCGGLMERNGHHGFLCPNRKTGQQLAILSACGFRVALADAPGRPFTVPLVRFGGNPLQPDITAHCDALALVPRTVAELKAMPGFPKDATFYPKGDIIVTHNGAEGSRTFVLDFVVTFPGRDSILMRASVTCGAAASVAEAAKITHYCVYYKNLLQRPNAIIPCAMEVFGTLGERYHTLIRAIADMSFPQVALDRTDTDGLRSRFIERMRQHASVTLARIVGVVFTSWRIHMYPCGQ